MPKNVAPTRAPERPSMPERRDISFTQARFLADTINVETRTVDLVWSTGAAVLRYDFYRDCYFNEVLSMDPAHVDLSRLNSGTAPLLDTHSTWSLSDVIGVVERSWIVDGEGHATVRIADVPSLEELWTKIRTRIICNVSIGYRTFSYERTAPADGGYETRTAVNWQPNEISLVPVQADQGAGVRNEGGEIVFAPEINPVNAPLETQMPNTVRAGSEPVIATPPVAAPVAPAPEQRTAPVGMTATETLTVLRLAGDLMLRNEAEAMVAEGLDGAAIRMKLAELAADKQRANATIGGPARAQITRDEGDTIRRGLETAIMVRANPGAMHSDTQAQRDMLDQASRFRGMRMLQVFSEYTEATSGVRLRGFSPMEMATLALGLGNNDVMSRAGLSGSDFPYLLANVASKRMRDAYGTVTQAWRGLGRQSNNPDFKDKAVVALSGIPNFQKVREGQEYSYAGFSDSQEKYALGTYGRIVAITRQALINDDMGAFNRLPEMIGRGAAELENDLVWGIFSGNPNMADGKALFHADHGNLGTGADVTEAAMALMEQAMLEQKDASGKTPLNLRPATLVVTPKRKIAAQKLLGQISPAKSSDFNAFVNSMNLVVEARLKPVSGNEPWFIVGEPAMLDTFEYAYLDGEEGLYTESRTGFEVDGIEVKGRLDFAAKAIDYRNMAKNPGA